MLPNIQGFQLSGNRMAVLYFGLRISGSPLVAYRTPVTASFRSLLHSMISCNVELRCGYVTRWTVEARAGWSTLVVGTASKEADSGAKIWAVK